MKTLLNVMTLVSMLVSLRAFADDQCPANPASANTTSMTKPDSAQAAASVSTTVNKGTSTDAKDGAQAPSGSGQ